MTSRPYVDLHTVYPNKLIECETYKITPFALTTDEVQLQKARSIMSGKGWTTLELQPNFQYVKLVKKGEGTMMSDTPMERNSNRDFVRKANGDVLIFGLGLGLIIMPLLDAEEVTSITVIELHQDLIDLVTPILKKYDHHNKLKVVQGDCFEYHKQVEKGTKFDCVYGDIWIDIDQDNYDEMKALTKVWKYKINRHNHYSFIDHWMKDHLKYLITKEKRECFFY